ncbi:MAG: hypothetical protein MK364_18160 [Pirellulales bacterium]|jgi:predicted homoserine dehydrogenase-like protein|nr:hypothetical protein [Pirellulales bacterium]
MYLAQLRSTLGVQLAGIADLAPQRAYDWLLRTGWNQEQLTTTTSTSEINAAAARQCVGITDDPTTLLQADLQVIIECTGDPEAGTRHALDAFSTGKHVVMVTVEADALLGPLLGRAAAQAGVVYSMAYGDQPALICELVDWARTSGFQIVAAGKGTRYLPRYHFSTPDTVFTDYGFSDEQVVQGGLNAQMFCSFLDGTKSAIEMAAVANATGLSPQSAGLQFPASSRNQLAEILKPHTAGGILTQTGTVEVVSSLHRDGSPVADDLRWGVYVTYQGSTDYVAQCFHEYGIHTDSSGHYAALYRDQHLIGLELGVSVASVALRNEPTGSPTAFLGDVAAIAKRKIKVNERLDGEGGYTVFGRLIPSQESLAQKALPIGLANGAIANRAIEQGEMVRYGDVQLPAGRVTVRLRKELESEFQRSADSNPSRSERR